MPDAGQVAVPEQPATGVMTGSVHRAVIVADAPQHYKAYFLSTERVPTGNSAVVLWEKRLSAP